MKFAHEFKAALVREGFLSRPYIPYSQLKKILKKVSAELQEIGLDPTTLANFNAERSFGDKRKPNEDGSITYKYDFEGSQKDFRPRLTLFFQGDLAVNATLSPDTRDFLKDLAAKQSGPSLMDNTVMSQSGGTDERPVRENFFTAERKGLRAVEVNLTFDSEFFDLIQGNVTEIDQLQAEEQDTIADEILELSKELTSLTPPPQKENLYQRTKWIPIKPSKTTDVSSWRELFDIYLQAGVFFSTREADSGSRSSTQAAAQLDWFQNEVMRLGLVAKFKLPGSQLALSRFVRINIALLRNIKYQELQQTAIEKITKKFKKRTHLDAAGTFPDLFRRDPIMSDSMAKALCAQISQDLIQLVPQLDDYDCPICATILYQPVRLHCGHLFCVYCVIRMIKLKRSDCPNCRMETVQQANIFNIDTDLLKFLKRNFPMECKQKRIDMETEAGRAQFGEQYTHPSQQKCVVM